MTYEEWKEWMIEQNLTGSEIAELEDFYALEYDNIGPKEGWIVKYLIPAEEWVRDICDSITTKYGDLGSFLKLHYIGDYGEFASAYAEYIMDDCELNTVCYCPATQRVIIFEVY